MTATTTFLVLDGGRARRLGGAHKAFLEIGERPIAHRLLDAVAPLAAEVLVATSRPDAWPLHWPDGRRSIPLRCVADEIPGAGPLAGIATGLASASHALVVVLAADMPNVSTAVLRHLLELAAQEPSRPVAPVRAGRPEPLHAVWPRELADEVRRALHAGERRPARLLEGQPTRWVEAAELRGFEGAAETFDDVDTPEDLKR